MERPIHPDLGRPVGDADSRISVGVGQHPALLLTALTRLLEQTGLNVRCASSSPTALERCLRRERPDVALVAAALGNGGGRPPLAFLDTLRTASPETSLVILVDELTPALAQAAVKHQVAGVVLGTATAEDVVGSLEQVAHGHSVFPPGWLAALRCAEGESLRSLLSDRQFEVLELIAAGLDNERIAQRLDISRNTVKFHVRVIYERLRVSNRVQAARALSYERVGVRA